MLFPLGRFSWLNPFPHASLCSDFILSTHLAKYLQQSIVCLQVNTTRWYISSGRTHLISLCIVNVEQCLTYTTRLTLCDPMDCSPPGSSVNGDFPGKDTGVGCHALLQGIFPSQGQNPGLPHCRQILYQLSYEGSLRILEWAPVPSPGDLPNPRIELESPALQEDSLPTELPGKPNNMSSKCLLNKWVSE